MAQPTIISRRSPVGQYTEKDNVASILSEIYRIWVPRGVVYKIDPTRPFLFYLTFTEEITPGGSAEQVLTCTYSPARVLNAAGGHSDGHYQGVYLTADGTKRTITAVSDHVDAPGTKTITISDASAAAHQVCYVPWVAARVVIKVLAPRGLGDLSYPIFEGNTKILHALNQYRFNRLECPFPLPPDFAIVVSIDAAWAQKFVSGTTLGSVNLAFNKLQIPIIQAPESDFFEAGESSPGHNLRMRVEEMMLRAVR
jgi:hypothetical protein